MLKNLQKGFKLRKLLTPSSSVFTNFYLSKIFSTHKAPEVEVFVDGKSVKVKTRIHIYIALYIGRSKLHCISSLSLSRVMIIFII